MLTVQFRDFPRTRRFERLSDALAFGLADGEAFDVSASSGAIVWLWEGRQMRVEGYPIDVRTARCVFERVVARSTAPGRRWLSFTRKISADGFHVTAHKTLRAAVEYGSFYRPNGW